MSTAEIVKKVNALVISKADSVAGSSSQNQTSETLIGEIVRDMNAVVISKADSIAGSAIQNQTSETPMEEIVKDGAISKADSVAGSSEEEVVKDVNAVVISKADSVGGVSLQHQTSEVPFPKRRRLTILGWDADGYPVMNPNVPSEK
ncbi:hypothetical protein SLA2020_400930 [Shorea laevis]